MDLARSQGTGTPAAISTRERKAPFAGDAAGLSPVNFATVLLEVKSLSRRFTASIIKSQLLGEVAAPVCRKPAECPRREGAATRSCCEPGPDPRPALSGGMCLIRDSAVKLKPCPVCLTLCPCSASLLVGTGTPGQHHGGSRAWAPRKSHRFSAFLVLLYCYNRIICISQGCSEVFPNARMVRCISVS